MPLVPAKCPECGGNINIDSEKRLGVCEYCKEPFVVQEAIQNFNTTYNITNNNDIKADIVNVYENKEKDFVIKGGTLIAYNGESTDVVIPDSVIVVNEFSFKGCKALRRIYIPNSLQRVDGSNGPFSQMQLDEVVLQEGIDVIPYRLFDNCHINSLTIPKSVKKIENYAFYASGIQSLDIQAFPVELGENVFSHCTDLSNIKYNGHEFHNFFEFETYIDSGEITKVFVMDLMDNTIEDKLVIPNGISRITRVNPPYKDMAPTINEIVIPDTVNIIDNNALFVSGLKCINIPSEVNVFSTIVGSIADHCLEEVVANDKFISEHITSFKNSPFLRNYAKRFCPVCGCEYKGIIDLKCKGCRRMKAAMISRMKDGQEPDFARQQ